MSASLWPIRAARLAGTSTERDGTRTATTYARPASDRQAAYLADLHAARGWPILDGSTLTADEPSRLIDTALRAVPVTAPALHAAMDAPQPPAGRYAVTLTGESALRFFHIDRPMDGRWAGYLFVSEQAGPETYPVKARDRRAAILAAIAADPDALARYGRELGVCGRCGRELTDAESRARGIGPVCIATVASEPTRPRPERRGSGARAA